MYQVEEILVTGRKGVEPGLNLITGCSEKLSRCDENQQLYPLRRSGSLRDTTIFKHRRIAVPGVLRHTTTREGGSAGIAGA